MRAVYSSNGVLVPDRGVVETLVADGLIAGFAYKSLAEGAKVEYTPEQGAKGMQATNVLPAE